MFETQNVPCYIERMGHKKLKLGADEYKGTEVVFRIDPFTAAQAAELGIKERLFRRADGEPIPDIEAVTFRLVVRPQRLEFRVDSSLKASLVLPDVRIVNRLHVRRPSDGTQLVARFRAEFAEVSGADLLYLKEALFEQRYMTFENAKAGLFDEAEAAARRESKDAKPARASRRKSDEPSGDESSTDGDAAATH